MATLATLMVKLGLDDAQFGTGLDSAESRVSRFGATMMSAGKLLTATVTLPLLGLGGIALKAASDYDGALDTIQTKTGATGGALTALGDIAREVYRSIPTDIQTAADVVATLSQRTDAAGGELSQLAQAEIELARITGDQLAPLVDATTQMFEKWGISTGEQVGALDKLLRASQETGARVGTLADNLVRYAQPLSELGFSFDESIAILAQFEEAGVNVDQAMQGLKAGLARMAEEGITDATEAFTILIDRIKGAPSDMEATRMAVELFGQRAGPELAQAIRDGRLDVDDLVRVIAGGEGTILGAAAATNDYAEKLHILKNRAIDAITPLGTQLFEALNNLMPTLERGAEILATLVEKFNGLPGPAQAVIGIFIALAAVAGPLLMMVSGFIAILPALSAAFAILTGPIGLVVLAIAGLFVAYQTNFLGFRDGVHAGLAKLSDAFNAIKPKIQAVADVFSTAFTAALPFLTEAFEIVKEMFTSFVQNAKQVLDGLVNIIRGVMQVIKGIFTGDWGLIKTGVTNIVTGIKDVVVGIITMLLASIRAYLSLYKLAFSTAWNAIKDSVGAILGKMWANLIAIFSGIKDTAYTMMVDAGTQIGQGLIDGINAMWDSVVGFAESLASAVYDKIKSALDILSPSKKTEYLGMMLGQGLVEGMAASEGQVSRAAAGMAGAAMTGMGGTNLYGGMTINVSGAGDPDAVANRIFAAFAREMALHGGGA